MLVRKGLPPLGYPKQSPEQPRIRGVDTRDMVVMQTDEKVHELVAGLAPAAKRIIDHYWLYGKPMREIAKTEKLSLSGVKWRIDAIKDKVAKKCNL